jgi:hypothetical protein
MRTIRIAVAALAFTLVLAFVVTVSAAFASPLGASR